MTTDITEIVGYVISLILAIISTFLVPYLKQKLSAEKLEQIRCWVSVAVSAAEMLYAGDGRGAEKKQYVLNFLAGKGFKIDEESIDALIEAAVHELNASLFIGEPIEFGTVVEVEAEEE